MLQVFYSLGGWRLWTTAKTLAACSESSYARRRISRPQVPYWYIKISVKGGPEICEAVLQTFRAHAADPLFGTLHPAAVLTFADRNTVFICLVFFWFFFLWLITSWAAEQISSRRCFLWECIVVSYERGGVANIHVSCDFGWGGGLLSPCGDYMHDLNIIINL